MRVEHIIICKFDELSEEGKERARSWYRELPFDSENAWEYVKDDAETVGLKIISLDERGINEGSFIRSALDTVKLIKENHGKECETYKTAVQYEKELSDTLAATQEEDSSMDQEDAYADCEHEFLHAILEDYRIMFTKEVEYQYADEQVDESIRANEYEFHTDGRRARV